MMPKLCTLFYSQSTSYSIFQPPKIMQQRISKGNITHKTTFPLAVSKNIREIYFIFIHVYLRETDYNSHDKRYNIVNYSFFISL